MMLQQMMQNNARRENDTNTVRLEAMQLPTFSGRVGEDLYKFIDQFSHFVSNYVRPAEWVARLKNAIQKDQGGY